MSTRQAFPVHTIHSDASLREAAQRLRERAVGALIVTDKKDKALGIVTDRDLTVRAVARGYDQDSTPVDRVMSAPLFSVNAGTEPEEIAAEMRKLGVRRMPILDGEKATEVLALDDVIAHLADRLSDLAATVQAPLAVADESAGQAGGESLLDHIEESFTAIRQRAAGAAWRAEAAFFDELDRTRARLKGLLTEHGDS